MIITNYLLIDWTITLRWPTKKYAKSNAKAIKEAIEVILIIIGARRVENGKISRYILNRINPINPQKSKTHQKSQNLIINRLNHWNMSRYLYAESYIYFPFHP